jgi:hypothetical protein
LHLNEQYWDLTVDDQLELVDELHLEITVDAIDLGDITSPGSAPPPQASPSRRIVLGHPRVLLLLSRWRWQMSPAAAVLAALADPSSEPLPDRRPLP